MKRMRKRLPALLLAAVLCLSLLPVTALAANFPGKFYASIIFSASSNTESFGRVTQSGSKLIYKKTGAKTDHVIYGMEYAGGAFFTVEGRYGKGTSQGGNYTLTDDGWRELRMYNSDLTSYRVIGDITNQDGTATYAIVDTAMDLSGAEPALYGTYNQTFEINGNLMALTTICKIDLTDGHTLDWLQVQGLSSANDIIYAIAFDENGTLYAVGADGGADGGEASLYTIDLESATAYSVSAKLVGDIKTSSGRPISTNFAQDMAFDHATGTLYWMENDENVLYTLDTDTAEATREGQVYSGNKAYPLQSFCIANDTALGQNKDQYMVSVIYTGGGKVTNKADDSDKAFYLVGSGEELTLALTPDKNGKLLSVKVDGRSVSIDNLTEYTFDSIMGNHVIEVAFRENLPVTQKDMTWFHYQGYEASFYTQHHAYKFYELPYTTDAPKEGYTQTLLDQDGYTISDDTVIIPGNYRVRVTHAGTDKYNALDVVYENALQLAKCPGTPGRPVVYGKVGCTQADLATTSALQDYYGTDGKPIDAAHDEIPVTLEWQDPETTYNTAGNFYASATIYAAQGLEQRLKDCYTLDNGDPLTNGCQISHRATQVVVLPADAASIIRLQASDASGGVVSGKGVYKNGDEVTVTAAVNGNAGFTFGGWKDEATGEIVSSDAAYTFNAGGDLTLIALFEVKEEYRVTLQTDPADAGAVTGGGSYEDGEHEATVIATPNTGYYFLGWYEGDTLVSKQAEYKFNVTADGAALTAKFGVDYLARAEQARTNFASALGTGVFEWSTLTEAVDAYEKAEEFVKAPPSAITNAPDRFDDLTDYYSKVIALDLSGLDIGNSDLAKLSLFTGVTELDLGGNRGVTSLDDLAHMTKLKTLGLSDTVITDLSGLNSLTRLETLDLSGNTAISDLSGLRNLTKLETLDLSGDRGVSDLSGLSGLEWLETLDISGTGVTAFDVLVNDDGNLVFPNLETLTARNLSLTSLSALAEFVSENVLYCYVTADLWDFTGSTLPDTEENRADVDTIQTALGEKFLPPTIRTPSSGGGGVTVYTSTVAGTENGTVTVSPARVSQNGTVTITVTPDEGYELEKLTVTDSRGGMLTLTDKGDGRYTFLMPGANVKIEASFREIPAQAANPFADVHEGDYYYDAVLWAVANGVTAGTSATTFSPGAPVTRAQMMTFLWRAHGSPEVTGSSPFTDVDEDAYYYDAVLWAVVNGITAGTSATTFSPDAPVTRAQSVTFQWRAAGTPAAPGSSFEDVAADDYYTDAVSWAAANGITAGTGGNRFSPDVVVTRAQAMTFLYQELA